ncbi:hypothetical protein DFS33DRAFT_329156 [Desarmillaria ectypa]|nr:hypothetical protein DFS33DRAFT_329156 [Desarmillaria ectypa]
MGHLNDAVHFSGGSTSLIQDNATYTRSRAFYWRDTKMTHSVTSHTRVRVNAPSCRHWDLGQKFYNVRGYEVFNGESLTFCSRISLCIWGKIEEHEHALDRRQLLRFGSLTTVYVSSRYGGIDRKSSGHCVPDVLVYKPVFVVRPRGCQGALRRASYKLNPIFRIKNLSSVGTLRTASTGIEWIPPYCVDQCPKEHSLTRALTTDLWSGLTKRIMAESFSAPPQYLFMKPES